MTNDLNAVVRLFATNNELTSELGRIREERLRETQVRCAKDGVHSPVIFVKARGKLKILLSTTQIYFAEVSK